MKQGKLFFLLIATIAIVSCRPKARQTAADAEQSTDRTKVVTSADTLRLVITDKHLAQTDSLIRRTLRLPLDSITVEIVNNTESTCITGEAYTIEQRVNDVWTILPIKPRKDGAVYAFNDIGYELAPRSTRLFTIHVEPDKYDFEQDRNTASSKSSSRKGRRYRKASIAIFHLSNPYPSKCYKTTEHLFRLSPPIAFFVSL